MGARVDHAVTSGTFSLDGQTFDVDNNVWLLGAVFTGDTLFQGGPGATGRSFSDFGVIIDSIRDRLLVLPPETAVHTGHGGSTTIGAGEISGASAPRRTPPVRPPSRADPPPTER
nr:MBL fold metallo-hydrolase [Planomonospora sp. ID67723]